ncbi:hypothetical protein NEOLEDRAFT_1020676, partial [Neolentinus lepideus HHB14362 ss-1]
ALLEVNEAIVSGSMALATVLRAPFLQNNWPPRDLDLYVSSSHFATLQACLLTGEFGFQLVNIHTCYPYPLGPNIAAISTLSHLTRDVKVDIIVSNDDNNGILPVFQFYGTQVMNWIAADGLFMAYPKLTFARHALFNPVTRILHTSEAHKAVLLKYQDRGFDFSESP